MNRISKNALACALISSVLFATTLAAKAVAAGTSNPDISANFLGLGRYQLAPSDQSIQNGISLQEAEVQFMSNVDPYLRAVALFSVSKGASGEYGIDPEEVYAETLALPGAVVKFGKFKAAIGRQNALHTHAYPFIDASLINTKLLGDEGLNDAGVSAAVMLPMPWFSEFTAQGMNAKNDVSFGSPKTGHLVGIAHLKNFFETSESSTFEWGLTGADGKNAQLRNSLLYGTDLTYKWRPVNGGKYHALITSGEYLYADRKGNVDAITGDTTAKLGGFALWSQYQFAERWWVQAREEFVGTQRSIGNPNIHKQSALLAFNPSEFSGFRFQYDHVDLNHSAKPEHIGSVQYNITIGAHPAHDY